MAVYRQWRYEDKSRNSSPSGLSMVSYFIFHTLQLLTVEGGLNSHRVFVFCALDTKIEIYIYTVDRESQKRAKSPKTK